MNRCILAVFTASLAFPKRRLGALFRAVGRRRQMFASDGVAESGFTRRVPAWIARRTIVTVATLAPEAYPGQAMIGRSDPYKIYGYEAM